MNEIKQWWEQASARDQLYIVVCGGCLALYIMFMAVYKPVKGMRDSQLKQNQAQMASLERVKNLASQVQNRNKKGNANSGPSIDSLVQASLSKNSLRASAMDSSGRNGVRIRLENAQFESFLAWLHEMEVSQGLRVKDLSVASGGSAGTVTVNLRLHKD